MNVKDKLSEIEIKDLEKLNNNSFNMNEWQSFSIRSIIAHLINASSVDEVNYIINDLDHATD